MYYSLGARNRGKSRGGHQPRQFLVQSAVPGCVSDAVRVEKFCLERPRREKIFSRYAVKSAAAPHCEGWPKWLVAVKFRLRFPMLDQARGSCIRRVEGFLGGQGRRRMCDETAHLFVYISAGNHSL